MEYSLLHLNDTSVSNDQGGSNRIKHNVSHTSLASQVIIQIELIGEDFLAILTRMWGRFCMFDNHMPFHTISKLSCHIAQGALKHVLTLWSGDLSNEPIGWCYRELPIVATRWRCYFRLKVMNFRFQVWRIWRPGPTWKIAIWELELDILIDLMDSNVEINWGILL